MNSVIKVERKLGLKAGDDGRGPRQTGVAAGGGGKGRAPPSLKQRKKKKPRPFYQDSSSSSADDESEYQDYEDRQTRDVVELTDDETDDETLDDDHRDNDHRDNFGGGGVSGGRGGGEAATNQRGHSSPNGSRPCAAALQTPYHYTHALT